MKASTALLLSILISASTASFDDNPWTPTVVSGFSAAVLAEADGPAPVPTGDDCENCNGTGKVGDGRTMLTCTECDGTGKKKKAEPVIPEDVPEEVPPTKEVAVEKPAAEEYCPPSSTGQT